MDQTVDKTVDRLSELLDRATKVAQDLEVKDRLSDAVSALRRTRVTQEEDAGIERFVTGLLVGVYAVLVTTAHRVFTDRSPAAVAGATLAAVALFNPLRRRVQRVVDRRFNRAHYDAEATIAAFAVRMQEAADLDEVRSDLLAVACQVMEPAHVSIWVRSRSS